MWVSTAIIGSPKAMLRTTLAVFRPTPGKFFERLARARHLAAVVGDELLRQGDDILRLGAVEADGADQLGDARLAEGGHLLRRIGEPEERRRRLVDAGIGRLRRKDHRDEERERIDVVELALRFGHRRSEAGKDRLDVLPRHARGRGGGGDATGLARRTRRAMAPCPDIGVSPAA